MLYTGQRGFVLAAVLIIAVLIAAFCTVSLLITTSESAASAQATRRAVALFAAQAGIEEEICRLKTMQQSVDMTAPFRTIDGLAGQTVLENVVLMKDGDPVGCYTVRMLNVAASGGDSRNLTVESTGWVPDPDSPNAVHRTVTSVLQLAMARSEVFDYVYFVNNWGWYYGNTIIANGNVRSNGQFDGGGYAATVNPMPRYTTLTGTDLSGRIDGGGLFSGWNVVGAQNMQGLSGTYTADDYSKGLCTVDQVNQPKYIHAWTGQVPMPNLTDLTVYEQKALAVNSSISIGGQVVCDGVVGDGAGEPKNLYLCGTSDNPIELNGPVVVRGNVIIQGYVRGKGCIYAAGNVLVAGDITYKNKIPNYKTGGNEGELEQWLADAADSDALGLFARQHIVVGNYTDPQWQSYVKSWVNDARNGSDEDAGLDQVPNTRNGRDGVRGTADDDVLEGDGVWTADRYTDWQRDAGVIPEGKSVGDAIPGTGEDIDGDAVYDPTTKMSELGLPAGESVITSAKWAGNPPGVAYNHIATNKISRLDAAFYTNHTIAMLTTDWGKDLVVNGCVVSRNEAIIYGTTHLILNYDMRLLDGGLTHGFYLPRSWRPIKVVLWNSDGSRTLAEETQDGQVPAP